MNPLPVENNIKPSIAKLSKVTPTAVTSKPLPTHISQSLQVFHPVSRFTDILTMKPISPDLLDLFDENDNNDNDGTQTLVEMCRAKKKRRRRLIKSVKRLSREREIDAREKTKESYLSS